MNHFKRPLQSFLVAGALVASQIAFSGGAQAQINNIQISLAASEPTSYDHTTGGGAWNQGIMNKDITNSLEGSSFKCDDVVSYLTKIAIPNASDLQALGAMTLDMHYSMSMDTTGQPGVALGDPVAAVVNAPDGASNHNSNSVVSITESSQSGDMFSKHAELYKTVRVSGLEAGEVVIIRIDTKIHCQEGSSPTGNIQFRFKDSSLVYKNGSTAVVPAVAVKAGEQTIDLKGVQLLTTPIISLAKTVTTENGTCPGSESITIEPTQFVKFCYALTNAKIGTGHLAAALYNVSSIADDNGKYPDFTAYFTSGLSDLDKDGQVDDLAAGSTAYGEYVTAFDGDQDSVITNLATVTGYSAPTGGILLTATDTATVNIDAPAPFITIDKVTNGVDSLTVLVGTSLTWSYTVTNTGDRVLTNVYVVDDQGVSVVCPSTTLDIGAFMTCTGTGTAIAGSYVNVGTAYGHWNGTEVSASDTSSYFGAEPKIDIQKSPDTQTVIEGLQAQFTITVTNTGNVALTSVVVTDSLAPDCSKSIGTLDVSGQYFYSCSMGPITSDVTNTASVSASYESTTVSDTDSANVIVDYLPNIEVTKSANPTSVDETGGVVTFTFSVKNKAPEDFILTSLIDNKLGNLNGLGSCVVPQTIAAGGTYTCAMSVMLASDQLTPHINVVSAVGHDPQDNQGSGSASATVTFNDVLPQVSMTKNVNVSLIRASGDYVDFTFTINNPGLESITVTSFVDSYITLSPECLSLVGQVVSPGGSIQCVSHVFVVFPAGTTYTNTASVTAQDNEKNSVGASASATIKNFWYGRSPGYWKNHPSSWISGYLPAGYVQSVFTIPATLLSGGVLDLNVDGKKDTLMIALGYKGGSTLAGAAQILLRASVAALLNEAYYGADYPAETSVGALIAHVNAVLATQNRDAYLSLAGMYDVWNNGVEGPLP